VEAKLGETLVAAADVESSMNEKLRYLSQAIKRFARSIELCDGYLRGYYGLKVATKAMMDIGLPKQSSETGFQTDDQLKALNKVATEKLREIINNEAHLRDSAEISAAKELLALDNQK
jgi:ER membrane protein complex subunit 2